MTHKEAFWPGKGQPGSRSCVCWRAEGSEVLSKHRSARPLHCIPLPPSLCAGLAWDQSHPKPALKPSADEDTSTRMLLLRIIRQDIPHKALRSLSCLRLSGHEFQVQIQRIGFGAAAGAQQLYSSITQARSGTAIPLNSKAHITARGTFDG